WCSAPTSTPRRWRPGPPPNASPGCSDPAGRPPWAAPEIPPRTGRRPRRAYYRGGVGGDGGTRRGAAAHGAAEQGAAAHGAAERGRARHAAAFAASAWRTGRLLVGGDLRTPPEHVGHWLTFADGTRSQLYRETVRVRATTRDPALLV